MTVSLSEKISNCLLAASDVTDLTGDQLNPSLAPQSGSKPYVVFEEIGGAGEETHEDNNSLDATDIQFNCYAKTKKEALLLRSAVRAALCPPPDVDGFPVYAMEGVKVSHPITRSIFEQPVQLHNAMLDLTFMHNPSA